MRVYLDHAATTPVEPRVLEAMLPFFTAVPGNASSLHAFGQDARAAVDQARVQRGGGHRGAPRRDRVHEWGHGGR